MNPDETPEDLDETEWNPSDDPTDYPEFWQGHDSDITPAADIIDKVLGGEASDAKDAIYAALYGKVGERIDGLRSELRNEPNDISSEIGDMGLDDNDIGDDGDGSAWEETVSDESDTEE